ncbi:ATP-dependent DNA ligase [Methanosarcina mazei]|uniref:ATP-dependent DNA ligase n=1 Tax=Methanosarcina mazei TaxID=2209 RepID=UPI000AA35243|nr:ATP-dependent DNA ligase [Methanosarcina mazei]
MVRFKELAELFEELEKTTSHREIVRRISEFFKNLKGDEVKDSAYLFLGSTGPAFENTTLGIKDMLAIRAIAGAYGVTREDVSKRYARTGDLGDVAFELSKKRESSLTIEDVFQRLLQIRETSGKGSQEEKTALFSDILQKATPEEGKYIVRLVLGRLRLGFGDQFLLEAFAIAFTGDKKHAAKIKESYSVCTDIGELAKILAENGARATGFISIKPGRPVKSMLSQRVESFEELEKRVKGKKAAEEKYDGERVQVHKTGEGIKAFSRRLEDITSQYPEIIEDVRKTVPANEIVLDGEIVAYAELERNGNRIEEFYPFQNLMQRRRKYEIENYRKKCPVAVFFFDILYLNGEPLLKRPYPERRALLEMNVVESGIIRLSKRIVTESVEEIEDFFNETIEKGLEGIVVKSMSSNSYYEAGKRSWFWFKWKQEYSVGMRETFDLVVVGSYYGRGKRKGSFGALLCAVLNEEERRFETLTKVGTGFTEEDAEEINRLLSDHIVSEIPKDVSIKKGMLPDIFIEPAVVIEVLGSEITNSPGHTAGEGEEETGLALRFPRFLRIRHDKTPYDAMTVKEVRDLKDGT